VLAGFNIGASWHFGQCDSSMGSLRSKAALAELCLTFNLPAARYRCPILVTGRDDLSPAATWLPVYPPCTSNCRFWRFCRFSMFVESATYNGATPRAGSTPPASTIAADERLHQPGSAREGGRPLPFRFAPRPRQPDPPARGF